MVTNNEAIEKMLKSLLSCKTKAQFETTKYWIITVFENKIKGDVNKKMYYQGILDCFNILIKHTDERM